MMANNSDVSVDSHSKLIRAGFLRQVFQLLLQFLDQTDKVSQAHAGIFHMLPLGLRVQDKLEALIDKYKSKLCK